MADFVLRDTYVVRETPQYRCVIDEFRRDDKDQMLVVHLKMHTASASAVKTMLREWRLLRECVKAPLYAWGEEDDDKYTRFMALLGFQQISFIPCTDGTTRRVFVSFPLLDFNDARKQHETDAAADP